MALVLDGVSCAYPGAPSRSARRGEPRGARGRALRPPRPERRRQDDASVDRLGPPAPRCRTRHAPRRGDRRLEDQARLRALSQDLALYPALTGRENLTLFGKLSGLPRARLAERIDAVLESVGLTASADRPAGTYSGGMKRRLNLAIAVLHEPRVLLLDEPTAGVDPQSRNLIFESLAALRARGATIVYTTHYLEEAERLCERIAIIDHGRVLVCADRDELHQRPRAARGALPRADGARDARLRPSARRGRLPRGRRSSR